MEEFDIYKDISERTNGDIYIGVVGPVRAGKSTFITNFMEKLVLPRIENSHTKERMKDELPQSANGKTIMTTQPKFVPNEAMPVDITSDTRIKVRLIDSVGYLVDGATGHMDGENQRMVRTPWLDEEVPFGVAAEIGTKKVIQEHSTIGIVMTSDGSITTDLPRSAYVESEERTVNELKELGKPFVVVLNSMYPASQETQKLAATLSEKYSTVVLPMDVLNLKEEDINELFGKILYEFPLRDIEIEIDKWIQALPMENAIVSQIIAALVEKSDGLRKMADAVKLCERMSESDNFCTPVIKEMMMGSGKVVFGLSAKDDLFYRVLSNECGMELNDDFALMASLKELVSAKREYDKLKVALDEVKRTGYGVVTPTMDEMVLDEPQIVKHGSKYGVKLRATAPSLHIMQVDIQSEVSPYVGSEQQSEEMLKSLLSQFENDPRSLWETNMFGKSLHMMVNEGLNNKLYAMPEDTQKKMRRTLSRIVNEGKGGIICILL